MKNIARVTISLAFVLLLIGGIAAVAAAQSVEDRQYRDWFELGERKLAHDQHFIDRAQSCVNNFTRRGLDTAAMQDVINDAQIVVLDPMIAALASGDEEAVKAALLLRLGNANNSQCTCGHYYAWFALERNQAVLNYITPIAEAKGLGDLVPPIQDLLDSARSQLESVGFEPFQSGQGESIREDLKEANELIRDLTGQLRITNERPPLNSVE